MSPLKILGPDVRNPGCTGVLCSTFRFGVGGGCLNPFNMLKRFNTCQHMLCAMLLPLASKLKRFNMSVRRLFAGRFRRYLLCNSVEQLFKGNRESFPLVSGNGN